MLELLLIPVAGLTLGILAIKLPYRYNPFRLKFGMDDDNAGVQKIPKIIGWILIAIFGLWLLGLGALIVLNHFK